MHDFYGEPAGVRIARKHIGWYLDPLPGGEAARREINRLDSAAAQYDAVAAFLAQLPQYADAWACTYRG
ncbi:MAG: tRNA dihydrouridine synthase DusB, partial [Neisseria sp.]|nr:tRNA dihydrouridine synthase DusB [Neisseria sp.]